MTDNIQFDDDHVRDALRDWWQSLYDHRRERAYLQRCRSLGDLLALDDRGQSKLYRFHNALHGAGFHRSHEDKRLAYVAGALAHIKTDSPGTPFAAQLAVSEDGTPRLTERRFQKLLQLEDQDRLHQLLIRVLRMMNGQANLWDLAKGVYYWNDRIRQNRIRQNWSRTYYAAMLQQAEINLGEEVRTIGAVAKAWWETLDNHPGERAMLRRCHSIDDVLMQRGFHRFRLYAKHAGITGDWQLAAVAGLLAHVREDDSNGSFAKQMATSKENHSRARFSGLRFRRLVQIEERNDLYHPLIRAIHHLERKANVERLASDVYYWNRETRQVWTTDYWMTAKDEK